MRKYKGCEGTGKWDGMEWKQHKERMGKEGMEGNGI
jgi:hypothetical protein